MATPNVTILPTQNVGRDVQARYARQAAAQQRRQREAGPAAPGVLGPVSGVLNEVEDRNGRNGRYLRGRLTLTVDGAERTVVALVSNQAIAKVETVFIAGQVRLYGDLRANTFSVIGPVRAGRTRAADKAATPAEAGRGRRDARKPVAVAA